MPGTICRVRPRDGDASGTPAAMEARPWTQEKRPWIQEKRTGRATSAARRGRLPAPLAAQALEKSSR